MIYPILQQALSLALEISPLMVLGLSIAGLLHVLVPEDAVERHLGQPGWRAVLKATALAVPLPLCSCSVVPVVASLRRKGASAGASVSFLVAAPQIGADSFLLTQGLMGPVFALWRIVASALTALLGGFALDGWGRQPAPAAARQSVKRDWRAAPVAFARHTQELVGAMASNLLVGLVLAALILSLLPEGELARWQGEGPWLAMMAMLLIGLPMYVCATASTPIAAALVAKGLHPGAALVFLLAGPATNLVTMVMVKGQLGWKALWIYLVSIAAVALGAGWAMGELEVVPKLADHCLHEHDVQASWLQLGGTLLLGLLMARHYLAQARVRWLGRQALTTSQQVLELPVEGMTCAHCAGRVEQALMATGLVKQLQVNLGQGRVQLELISPSNSAAPGLDEATARERLTQAVVDAGYTVPASSQT